MEQLIFTAFLNRLFGPAVLALLQALHIHPKHPATPISNSFAMNFWWWRCLRYFLLLSACGFRWSVRAGCSMRWKGSTALSLILPATPSQITREVRSLSDGAGDVHSELQSDWAGAGLESPTRSRLCRSAARCLRGSTITTTVCARTAGCYLAHFIGPQDKDIRLCCGLFCPF